MTNLQSIAGSFCWAAVAAILMLITFEPVSVEKPGAAALQVTAATASASNAA